MNTSPQKQLPFEFDNPVDQRTLEVSTQKVHEANEQFARHFADWINVVGAELKEQQSVLASHKAGFEKWVAHQYGWTASRARQLIDASEIVEATATIVAVAPSNEAQCRELVCVPDDALPKVWKRVVGHSKEHGEPITAKLIRQFTSPFRNGKPAVSANEQGRLAQPNEDTTCVESLDELREGAFGTIYADPPWPYSNQATRASTDNHYETMSVEQIAALPVARFTAADAHLHIWTTSSFLPATFDVIRAWGFEYKSSFCWVKPHIGMGNYWRISHEVLLTAIRGKPRRIRTAR